MTNQKFDKEDLKLLVRLGRKAVRSGTVSLVANIKKLADPQGRLAKEYEKMRQGGLSREEAKETLRKRFEDCLNKAAPNEERKEEKDEN